MGHLCKLVGCVKNSDSRGENGDVEVTPPKQRNQEIWNEVSHVKRGNTHGAGKSSNPIFVLTGITSTPHVDTSYDEDNKDARHVKTYEVSLKDKDFVEGPWSQNNLDNGADLLIPVPPPFRGVLIIGEETIVYCSASAFKAIPIRPVSQAVILVTGLKIEHLGETSIASTISYLDNAFVYVGSSFGDSQLVASASKLNLRYSISLKLFAHCLWQLVKLNVQPDAKGSYVEVLERYVNLGPIVDFCMVDLERQGQGQVVTCSGAYKGGSLRIVRNGIGINEQASVELQGTSEGKQKLRFHSLVGRRCLSHDAVHIQLVQLGEIGEFNNKRAENFEIGIAPADLLYNVLLATRVGHLVYLEIGDGLLVEKKHAELEYDVSCLDINPIGDNPNYSNLAAVGMWTGISVRIFSLPDLTLKTEEHLGGEIIPRSVLLCAFEGSFITFLSLGGHAETYAAIEEQSRTFAICSLKYKQSSTEDSEMHFIRLLDDQTFDFISSYSLDQFEYGCSILSCSFSDDNNAYYCVGTAYVMPEENEPTKSGKLQLSTTFEVVYLDQQWCGFIVECLKGFLDVGYLHEEGAIEERDRDYNANWMPAVEILDDDIYLGAENNFNLFTVRKNSEGVTDEERGRLEVVGEYHLGEFVNRFLHSSLMMRLPDSDVGQIPTIIFGTVNGVIGVIASLPLLEALIH
ncbi:DNA damage-binding protein 1 [Tanacetum coccineum]